MHLFCLFSCLITTGICVQMVTYLSTVWLGYTSHSFQHWLLLWLRWDNRAGFEKTVIFCECYFHYQPLFDDSIDFSMSLMDSLVVNVIHWLYIEYELLQCFLECHDCSKNRSMLVLVLVLQTLRFCYSQKQSKFFVSILFVVSVIYWGTLSI